MYARALEGEAHLVLEKLVAKKRHKTDEADCDQKRVDDTRLDSGRAKRKVEREVKRGA